MSTQVRALFIPGALRRAGLTVEEMRGWKERGRPPSTGGFDPRAVMVHHDASGRGPTPGSATFIAKTGRPEKGIFAPLAHCWVDTDGTWHVLAAGRTNHAGKGRGFGRIPPNCGNLFAIGVETDHTTGERWVPKQRQAVKLGVAALVDAMHIEARTSVCGHKEYTRRKPDPDPMDMDEFRSDVAALAADLGAARNRAPMRRMPAGAAVVDLGKVKEAARIDPGAPEGHVTHKRDVLIVEQALVDEGFREPVFLDGSFGTKTVAAFKAWQRRCGLQGDAVDGVPRLMTLTKLGHEHGFRVKR
ncbi:MAG: peptidoglycan recognition protein family protein [Actinomycetes bacterium]